MSGCIARAKVAAMTTEHSIHLQSALSHRAGRPRPLTLPGQAAAPDGPLDMTMMYVMHHAFRRDLRALARAARVTPLGDRVAWRELDAGGGWSPTCCTTTTPARTRASGHCSTAA